MQGIETNWGSVSCSRILCHPPVSVASELLSTRTCNEFASFFTGKIQKIKQAVSASMSGARYVLSLCPLKINSNTTTQFYPINNKDLEDNIKHLKSSLINPPWYSANRLLQKCFKLHSVRSSTNCKHVSHPENYSHQATLKKEEPRHATNEQLSAHIKPPVFKQNQWKSCFSTSEQLPATKQPFWCLPVRFSTTPQHWDCSC